MSLSSIHIQKATKNTFSHNSREENNPAKTINPEYSENNICNIGADQAQKNFDNLYQERTEKSKNRTATKENSLVEAVVNIEPNTTQEQLKNLTDYIEKEFDFKLIQTAIHKDEGHKKDDKLEINYHAHLVFCSINDEGKQMFRREHINKEKLSNLQDNTAEILGMERGEIGSTAKRLSHKDFKEHKIRTEPLHEQIEALEIRYDKTIEIVENYQENTQKEIEKLKNDLEISKSIEKTLKNDLKTQKEENKELREELKENGAIRSDYAQIEAEMKEIKEQYKIEMGEQKEITKNLSEELDNAQEQILEQYQEIRDLSPIKQSKDLGMSI